MSEPETPDVETLSRVVAVINGKGGVLKCVAGHTIVHDAVTGQPRTMAEAVADPSFCRVASCDSETGKIVVGNVVARTDSGVQDTIRLTTRSGRSVTLTGHHPLLLPEGWRRADEVKVGETIALPAVLPEPLMPVRVPEELVDLAAILVAEGSSTTNATGFATTDPQIVARASAGARVLGATVKHRTRLEAEAEGINYVLVAAPGVEVGPGKCGCGCGGDVMAGRQMLYRHYRRSTVKQFRIDYGLDGVRAKDKHLPAPVWSYPTDQVARFLGVLLMCDGHVSQSGMVSATFASEALTRDIQTLFLRLGIQSTVSTVKMPHFHAWQVLVHARCLPRLAEQLPMWGRKRDRLSVRVAKMKLRSNSNLGAPTLTPALRKELVSVVRPGNPYGSGRPTLRNVARRVGWNMEGARGPRFETMMSNPVKSGQRQLSPKVLGAFLTEFDLTRQHGWLLNDDLHWDPVVKVEPAGAQQTYDVEVEGTHSFIANDIVVHNSSIVANVSGCLAKSGMRVLAIDLDISGNLKLDFGLVGSENDDAGKGIVDAVWNGTPLQIVNDVRPGLDFVFGGRGLEMLGQLTKSSMAEDLPTGSVAGEFAARLTEVADDYDLILLDCPPGNGELQDMALAATRWVLIPTKTDQASWDGLLGVGPRVKRARQTNPDLTYLGVVVTAHNPAASRVRRNTKARLAEVGETVPLLESFIRHSETAAHDCRSRGQLAHELARDAVASKAQRLSALSARRRGEAEHSNVVTLPTALSGTADSLAGDYARLAQEMCQRITTAETNGTAVEAGSQA